jgi:iron-sulfur cluster repair protein YtfE (RIC family)
MKPASKNATTDAQDAIALLTDDHKAVQKLFKEYEELTQNDADEEEKGALAKQICMELAVHAQIEEEIFYPAVREAIEDGDLLDEAEVEHASAKELIAQIGAMAPGEELYDAKVTVLGEYVNHHIAEEQDDLFPQAQKAKLAPASLGAELMERKLELQAELGVGEETDDGETEEEETVTAGGRKPASKPSKARAAK